jgi:para-nitrobenzyl esterase
VSFAVRGDCGWPRYDPVRRETMRFDVRSTVVDDPLGPTFARWAGAR